MRTKVIVAIMMTMLLLTLASVFPVKAQGTIKIGVIGPVGWPQMQGMQEGATIAMEWINSNGGIVIDGTPYNVALSYGDEHAADMRPDLGAAEMERLCDPARENVDFVVGGFRTECVQPIHEVAVNYHKLFFISGAATNQLIACGTGTCGKCVQCDYNKYKYMFRVTPINDTMLAYNILGFLKGYVLPYKLAPLYGQQLDGDPELDIKTAVIAEDLDWTINMYNMFVYGGYLGPQANIVYSARTPWNALDFSSYLDAMHAAGVRLIVHIFSASASMAFITQLAGHQLKAVAAGIDVLGQMSDFWTWTGGKSQYEAFLASTGTRSPISETSVPYTTTQFWDVYYARFGHAPIYTAWGVYDSIIAMRETLQSHSIHPPFDQAKTDLLVPIVEQTDRVGTLGRFKYTTVHDVFSNEFGSTWTQGYVRAVWAQWQQGRLEVVWPMDRAYSKMYVLPSVSGKMYPYPTDVNQDGKIDVLDIATVGYAFGSKPEAQSVPPHPRWQFAADVDRSKLIDGNDNTMVCYDFDKIVDLPLLYGDEAGHLH